MKTYAYIKYEKTQTCAALVALDVESESDAFEYLEKVHPVGEYATLICAFVPDDDEVYAYWRDDSGALDDSGYFDGSSPSWYIRSAGHDVIIEEMAKASGECSSVVIGNYVTCSVAAQMLGVSVGRASQLADRGQLDTVTIGGRKMVTKQSVIDRLESKPTAGRPRK